MATLKDVARLAKVDVSTVSRALNNHAYVHPDTKARILDAVKQLSYQPNLLAKGLRQGKRQTIGLVVPSLMLTVFGEIAQGVELEARALGYGVMICNTKDEPEQEAACLNRLRNGLVDGILIASTGDNTRLLRDIRAGGVAVVQLIRAQDKTMSSVAANYRRCAYDGVRHLIARGCSRIGLINGKQEIVPYLERHKGYVKAIREARLDEIVSKSELPRFNHYEDGYKGAHYLMDKFPDLDGIVTAVDLQGLGALRALKERGISVPAQCRIISLTGHSIGGMLERPMTSMEIPAQAIGARGMQLLVEEIESAAAGASGQILKPARSEVLEASLVVRETT